MSKHVSTALEHYYREFRRHQLDTYGDSLVYIEGVNQRQFTGGGAAYGEHALAAYNSARRFIYFRKRLKEMTA